MMAVIKVIETVCPWHKVKAAMLVYSSGQVILACPGIGAKPHSDVVFSGSAYSPLEDEEEEEE